MRPKLFAVFALVLSAAFTGGSCDSSGNHGSKIMDIDWFAIPAQLKSHFNSFLDIKSAKMTELTDQVKESIKHFNGLFRTRRVIAISMLIYQFNTVYKEYSALPPQYIDEITRKRLDSRLKVIRMNVVSADLSYKTGNWDMYEIAYKDVREQIENFRAELNVLVVMVQEKLDKLYSSRKDSVFHMLLNSVLFFGLDDIHSSVGNLIRFILDVGVNLFRVCYYCFKIPEAEAELDFLSYHHEEANKLAETLQQDYNDNFIHKLKEDKAKKASNNKAEAAYLDKPIAFISNIFKTYLSGF